MVSSVIRERALTQTALPEPPRFASWHVTTSNLRWIREKGDTHAKHETESRSEWVLPSHIASNNDTSQQNNGKLYPLSFPDNVRSFLVELDCFPLLHSFTYS